jgi:hypothetical protein
VVDVAVGEQDLFQLDVRALDEREDALEVAARIDHRGAVRFLADQQRAVLLERRDRNDADLHGAYSPFCAALRAARWPPSAPAPKMQMCKRRFPLTRAGDSTRSPGPLRPSN